MAKKRKAKRVRKDRKTVKAKAVMADNSMRSAHTLGLAGGFVVLISGILAILNINIWSGFPQVFPNIVATVTTNMAVGIISGLAILIATATARKNARLSGAVMLIFSLIALATPPMYGLIFGPVLGLIGSVLLLMRK